MGRSAGRPIFLRDPAAFVISCAGIARIGFGAQARCRRTMMVHVSSGRFVRESLKA
jgi:hypothetical protein